ncbi:MAG: hypothetical protein CM15mP87_09950 [Candidatus Neomarinimicrobiota bacterium]|nr:MAG: hypothetical protein CM15mP87_09950 [Candidatus Neomarinimicrobiota bacterium]
MPNSDNSDCRYGILFTVIIVPPSGSMSPVVLFTLPIEGADLLNHLLQNYLE